MYLWYRNNEKDLKTTGKSSHSTDFSIIDSTDGMVLIFQKSCTHCTTMGYPCITWAIDCNEFMHTPSWGKAGVATSTLEHQLLYRSFHSRLDETEQRARCIGEAQWQKRSCSLELPRSYLHDIILLQKFLRATSASEVALIQMKTSHDPKLEIL